MASSSGNGGKRSNAKPPGKAEKSGRKTQEDESDKICGFHPLRSLRNIFFGYRARGKPSLDEDADSPSAKAKSTDDIAEKVHRQQDDAGSTTVSATVAVVVHAPVTASNSARSSHRAPRTSVTMAKQLSKSVDNLDSPTEWIPAPHGIPSAVTSPAGSADSNLNASVDEIDGIAALDSNSVDEFFKDKWSEVRNSRSRAFSSGDADAIGQKVTFDLDSVDPTEALNVSVAKGRIAIKPPNKRVTIAMQQKMLRTETTPRPTKSYHLQSPMEDDKDEGERETEQNKDSPDVVAETEDKVPDRPIRREKKQLLPAPDKSGRMTINITPDMLSVARKKATDRSSVAPCSPSSSNPRPKVGPPPPTCPKKRKTVCVPEGGACVQENRKKEESPEEAAENGAALGISVARRPLLSVKEDEVVAGEDEETARPKAPPRVRPKTRPKTMMTSPGSPQTAETRGPEWVNRANETNALVD